MILTPYGLAAATGHPDPPTGPRRGRGRRPTAPAHLNGLSLSPFSVKRFCYGFVTPMFHVERCGVFIHEGYCGF